MLLFVRTMRKLINTVLMIFVVTFGLQFSSAYAQYYDDLYTTPTKAKEQRQQYQKEAQLQKERRAAERARRIKKQQEMESEELYYNAPVDDNGFSEYEIDAYNRRNDQIDDDKDLKYKTRSNKSRTRSKLKKGYAGKYSDRINRFYRDDAVVITRGNKTIVVTDDCYYDYDSYYIDGGDQIVIINGSSFWPYSFIDIDPFYPWYDPWYYSFGWGPRYPRHWNWGFSWNWGYYWSWNYSGWGTPWNPYYNGYYGGYRHGYYDGYYNGYYHGYYDGYYGYDPYNGSYYQRYNRNYYRDGRRSGEALGARDNVSRNGRASVSSSSSSLSRPTGGRTSRASYARGDFWKNPQTRDEYNLDRNINEGRIANGGRAPRAVRDGGSVNQNRINDSRGVTRIPRNMTQNSGRAERATDVDRSVFRLPKNNRLGNNSREMRSLWSYERERAVTSDSNRSRRSWEGTRPSRSTVEQRPSRSTYDQSRAIRSSSSSSWGSSSSSSSRSGGSSSSGGGHRNSGGRR